VIFKNPATLHKQITTLTIFSIQLKINISVVNLLNNCFTMKFLANLTEYYILKYYKV